MAFVLGCCNYFLRRRGGGGLFFGKKKKRKKGNTKVWSIYRTRKDIDGFLDHYYDARVDGKIYDWEPPCVKCEVLAVSHWRVSASVWVDVRASLALYNFFDMILCDWHRGPVSLESCNSKVCVLVAGRMCPSPYTGPMISLSTCNPGLRHDKAPFLFQSAISFGASERRVACFLLVHIIAWSHRLPAYFFLGLMQL